MCLILFSFQPDSSSPLAMAANRDEFFERATAPAAFWQDAPDVLAGRDLVAGGTWLGMSQYGRFAAVTNVREPGRVVANARSRGDLTREFLTGNQSPETFLKQVQHHQEDYAGFNLLVGEFGADDNSLYYLSNRHEGIRKLGAGVYGLSNHLLDSHWPKVDDGKQALADVLQQGREHTALRELLENPEAAEDIRLPETGVGYEREKALSSTFITLPGYGTRASTVLTIDNDRVRFSEQAYEQPEAGKVKRSDKLRRYEFALRSNEMSEAV